MFVVVVYLSGDSVDCLTVDVRVVVVVVSDSIGLDHLDLLLGFYAVELYSLLLGVDTVGVQQTQHLLVVGDLVIHLCLLLG